jgi:hypothetical protein
MMQVPLCLDEISFAREDKSYFICPALGHKDLMSLGLPSVDKGSDVERHF